VGFYDPAALRTIFFDFSDANWEKELMAFKGSDVEVPASMVVDGQTYKDVGVRFRGSSSFMMVPEGLKHSIDVTVDFTDKKQNISGYRSLNLLNSHEDPSFLRSVLFLDAAREYVPAAAANLVRVVINGESWGVYGNVEQVNKDFVSRTFKAEGGARWKVPGSPGGRGGLEYSGEDPNAYKRVFEIKTKDDPKSWAALINLTKVLNQTPPDRLEAARLLTYRAARLIDEGKDAVLPAAYAKKFATDMAVQRIADCIQAMGANGLRADYPLARHLAGAKIAAYTDGSIEMMNERIGAALPQVFG